MHVIWDTPSAKNIQLEGKNIAGKKGKEKVDPARISSDIKDYVEGFYPIAVADMHSGGASVVERWKSFYVGHFAEKSKRDP